MRRFLLTLMMLIALIGVVGWLFQGPIAMRVMSRVLAANLAADPIGDLADGLHVTLCGAGGPLPDPVRSGPCVAIVAGETLYVVDAGSGAARNLTRQGLSPGLVEAVFLTHFHSDHIDGLGELGMLRWAQGGHRRPLTLYGADGVSEIAQGLNQAYRLDAIYRTAHHGSAVVPPTGSGFRVQSFPEPAPGEWSSTNGPWV